MTEKNKKAPLLEIQDLRVLFPVHKKWLPAVDGVNLSIRPGEITGVVENMFCKVLENKFFIQ